jgi:tRNA(fMet)-specific endonuclease VapC
MFTLDTNVCIGLLKGASSLVAHFGNLQPSEVSVSSVVRAELFFGARKSQKIADNLAVLRAFLAPLHSLTFDDRSAEEYGLIRADLERKGTPIGPNDLMIAAIARAHDCVLVTRNEREFGRVVGLQLQAWD